MTTSTRTRPRPGPNPRPVEPTGPVVDPRIRARRREVQRTNGRRRLRRVVDLLVVLSVVLVFVGALRSPLLDVDQVVVTGARESGRDAVVAAAGVNVGDQLMDVRLGSAGRGVTELPWVADVTVSRSIDGVVRLEVDERTPVAAVASGTDRLLVDAAGRVLGPGPRSAEYVTIEGPETPVAGEYLPGRFADVLAVAAALSPELQQAIDHLVPGPSITAVLRSGGTVELGPPTRLSAKLRSLITVLDQVDLTCLATIDLRAPGSPVLTRALGCS